MIAKRTTDLEREDYYARMGPHNLAPLWEVFSSLVRLAPAPQSVPALWRYEDIRPFIMEAGEVITAEEAERRVLVLENPGLEGQSGITESIYAGLQLILPGEVAPSHRHSQSALRFIIEGEGAFTSVDGERVMMKPGDYIITPPWSWHHHGNESRQAVVWLDGLDVPVVSFVNATFAEMGARGGDVPEPRKGEAAASSGLALLAEGAQAPSHAVPGFSFPYARAREALDSMGEREEARDACHGIRLRYVDPRSGADALPTIGSFLRLLPKGFESAPYRSSDGTVFSVAEGRGRTVIGDETLSWGPRDTFVIPSWALHRHLADEDAVLFSFSDRPVQEKLGLWREERSDVEGGDGG